MPVSETVNMSTGNLMAYLVSLILVSSLGHSSLVSRSRLLLNRVCVKAPVRVRFLRLHHCQGPQKATVVVILKLAFDGLRINSDLSGATFRDSDSHHHLGPLHHYFGLLFGAGIDSLGLKTAEADNRSRRKLSPRRA